MQRYRDFLPSAPEELGSFLGLKTVLSTDPFPREHWGKRACALVSCYNGSAELGEKAMAPILKDLPPPMFNRMGVMPFPSLQGMFDPFLPKGLQWYWKGDYVKALPDEAIDAHIAQAANTPSELSLMHLYPISMAPSTASARMRRPGVQGTRPGRWSSPESMRIPRRQGR